MNQIFGVVATYTSSFLIDVYGSVIPTMIYLMVSLVIGTVITVMIKADLRRTNCAISDEPPPAKLSYIIAPSI